MQSYTNLYIGKASISMEKIFDILNIFKLYSLCGIHTAVPLLADEMVLETNYFTAQINAETNN